MNIEYSCFSVIKLIKSALVLGSTSFVARAICFQLAEQGCLKFHLISRNPSKNKDFLYLLRNKYNIEITEEYNDLLLNSSIDNPFIPKVDNFDLYLITAGYLGDNYRARSDISEAIRISSSNYIGILPWINMIASNERISKPGKLWVFSSVAGDLGRSSNYHYGAAKSALTTYLEGLHSRCYKKPFQIRIIKAGFIDTPMTKGKAPKILCISPEKVAKRLLSSPNKKGVEYLPRWWSLVMFIVRHLPLALVSKL